MPINSRQKGAVRSVEDRIKVITRIVRSNDQGLLELRTRKAQMLRDLFDITCRIKWRYGGHHGLKEKLKKLKKSNNANK